MLEKKYFFLVVFKEEKKIIVALAANKTDVLTAIGTIQLSHNGIVMTGFETLPLGGYELSLGARAKLNRNKINAALKAIGCNKTQQAKGRGKVLEMIKRH